MSSPREHVERKAARNHGVVLRPQALDAGMNVRQIKRRLERGQWVPAPVPGAYLLAYAAGDPAALLAASCLALDGIPWAQSAVACWDLAPHPLRPTVAIHGRGVCAEVDVIRPRTFDHVALTRHHGIRVPTVESAVATMASTSTVAGLQSLLDEALRRQLTAPERILDALQQFAKRGRAGSAVIGEVLSTRRVESTAPLSDWGRWFANRLEASGFGRPVLEHRVLDLDGALIAQVDAAYVDACLAFELDSVAHHHNLRAFEIDRARDLRLAAHGWRTLRVTWRQYTHRWHEITEAVRALRDPGPCAG